MSAAELFRWPITKWTRPCGNFIESTMGSPKWCATCSFARHAHKRKEKPVAEIRMCSYCVKPTPAVYRCQCADAKCKVMACAAHRHLTQNPALIPTAKK